MQVPISYGELYDKFSILEIKMDRIKIEQKRVWVKQEYDLYAALIAHCPAEGKSEIKDVNLILWEIEEIIRQKEEKKEFDEEFICLARNVYKYNDLRAAIKQSIDIRMKSDLREMKSY